MNDKSPDGDHLRTITESVIGAAMEVMNELGPGLSEKCYENALLIELVERGHHVEQQQSFTVKYKDRFVGKLTPDLIVDGCLIVDPKVVEDLNSEHTRQMLTYLAVSGLSLALLINFKRSKIEWKRVAAPKRQ